MFDVYTGLCTSPTRTSATTAQSLKPFSYTRSICFILSDDGTNRTPTSPSLPLIPCSVDASVLKSARREDHQGKLGRLR
jgi:hypothetical protein